MLAGSIGSSLATTMWELSLIHILRDCWLALQRTTVLSPAAGQIAKRGVQAGEVVSPGTPLMTVIPLHRLWIDANFKEVQLHKMRIGQPALIRVDMYGGDVTYHGRVTGFSAGTGSAFSLLPPQNATGNWIKIVQRVPVRIEIDPADLREHPLLVGLSAVVKVDTSDTSGRLLAASARTEPVPGDLVSQAPAVDFAPVEATISGIIRDNALPGVCPVQGLSLIHICPRRDHQPQQAGRDPQYQQDAAARRPVGTSGGRLRYPLSAARGHGECPLRRGEARDLRGVRRA